MRRRKVDKSLRRNADPGPRRGQKVGIFGVVEEGQVGRTGAIERRNIVHVLIEVRVPGRLGACEFSNLTRR